MWISRKVKITLVLAIGLFLARGPSERHIAFAASNLKSVPNSVIDLPFTGTVTSIDFSTQRLDLKDDFGKSTYVIVSDNIEILRDGKPVTATQLRPGDHIMLRPRME